MSLVAFFLSTGKSYKKYIDPQKYKTLHKQLNILEKQNERAVERLNIRQVKDFSNKLSGYTNCVTTNNCSPSMLFLRKLFESLSGFLVM
jgi:hypothetical protein